MRSATITCDITAVFSHFVPFLLQRKIVFEVLGHGASKQNYNLKHNIPATWISLCLLKVTNSNAIITKKAIKNNNELSVSSAFLEEWWDKLQSEAVESGVKIHLLPFWNQCMFQKYSAIGSVLWTEHSADRFLNLLNWNLNVNMHVSSSNRCL